jgi:hypothetical protein
MNPADGAKLAEEVLAGVRHTSDGDGDEAGSSEDVGRTAPPA